MADSSDIETSLLTLISGVLYPNGTSQPSIVGSTITIQRGWATEQQVASAVSVGSSIVSIFADKAMSRDATRYQRAWFTTTQTAATLTATLSGLVVTLGGTVSAGNVACIITDNVAYTYTALSTDTLATIATALAAEIPGAVATGATVTVGVSLTTDLGAYLTDQNGSPIGGADTLYQPAAIVVNGGTAASEVSRQQQAFRVCVWAPEPSIRDAIFEKLPALIANSYRLTLPDTSVATWMNQRETGPDDMPARAKMWRRDLLITYDWPVIYTIAAQAVAAVLQNYSINQSTAITYATV
ncbi:MAG: hypothetical protein P4L10_10950 [Acidobacteriaceae bacterium]|nr:hypothetical protein [Acidobacteriaceae bacterium]